MRPDVDRIHALANEHELIGLFEHRDMLSVAVVDEEDVLIGRVAIDAILDLMREESERALLNQAGLDEEESLFAPMLPSAKRRGVWLGINLVTVFLAAWVIGQFEEVLDKVVALAVLMPVVASMGGIAGSQTLTLVIRGLALDQIANANVRWLLFKEIGVGLLNGLVWSVVVAIVAYLWFANSGIAIVIALAMILNLLAAAISGISIPLILRRLGIDPALSGAVVLTTVTDIVGFLSFLGLASLFLL
jgi:magnesium transporter